jgi:hypothetical protein
MSVGSGDGFDRWLEQELQNRTGQQSGPSPDPAQAQYHAVHLQGGLQMSVLGQALAVVTSKGTIGLAVAALSVGAAGAAGEAAITGSASPGDWGQQVVQQVQTCKDALAPDSHGIGQCVSTFAKQHGKDVSSDHRASGARQTPPAHTPGTQPSHPGPSSHPTGRPSNVPPTTHP